MCTAGATATRDSATGQALAAIRETAGATASYPVEGVGPVSRA